MQTVTIEYRIRLGEATVETFQIDLDAEELVLRPLRRGPLPAWTDLGFQRCEVCTLPAAEGASCPLAASLVDLVERFERVLSYQEVHLEVVTDNRTIVQETSAQSALSSLMGLITATSGCPHTVFFRPMAQFHLPLALEEETIFRAVSTYLMGLYFRAQEGEDVDFDLSGLKAIYERVEVVNARMADRFRAAVDTDASVNALILLDTFAKTCTWALESTLEGMRHLFVLPYVPSASPGPARRG